MNSPADSYKATWNARSATLADGMLAVDGSADEAVLALTGDYTAGQVRAALELGANDQVFEIGCGVGRIGQRIAAEVAGWQGFDIADNMAALAAARVASMPGASAHAVSGAALPQLACASMDKGYCVAVFIHMDKEDMNLYLREVARVLRPGGLFYFDTWNLAHPVGWQRFAYEVDEVGRSDPSRRKDVARNQFCVLEEVRLYAHHAGLEVVFEHADSPWLQVVLSKPSPHASGAAADVAARLSVQRHAIAYSPRWTELFADACRVLIEGVHPQTMLDRWATLPSDEPELPMFIAWLSAIWHRSPNQWPARPA